MTIYLKFDTQEQAITALTSAGFVMSEYNDHFGSESNGWGTLFQIPYDTGATDEDGNAIWSVLDGWFANIYDRESAGQLSAFEVATPKTPYNVVA